MIHIQPYVPGFTLAGSRAMFVDTAKSGMAKPWAADWPAIHSSGCPYGFRLFAVGKTLWAYNLPHLAYIESFVEAKLRNKPERRALGERRTTSLPEALPGWMKSSDHPQEILDKITRLRATLPST